MNAALTAKDGLPVNDPSCRAANRPGHICFDKFGDTFDRANVGPRAGATCFFEAVSQLADQAHATAARVVEVAAQVVEQTETLRTLDRVAR